MAVEKLRRYELIFLVHPEAEDGQLGRMKDRVGQVLSDYNALVLKREDWGKRKLAYEIEKVNKAYYRYIEFISQPAMIAELERVLRLTDVVIRYQTIRLEDGIPADGLDRFEPASEEESKSEATTQDAPEVEAAPAAEVAEPAEETAAEEAAPEAEEAAVEAAAEEIVAEEAAAEDSAAEEKEADGE